MPSDRTVIWNRPERRARGPAPSLSRERIAAVAVSLADQGGLDAVSMRAVAGELEVAATALYRYVDSRDELIELMIDAVTGSDLQFDISGEWRRDLRGFAAGLRSMLLRHPWMIVRSAGLRSFGPNTALRHEEALRAVDGLGLEIDVMLAMIQTVEAYVRGRVLEEISEQEAVRRSGLEHTEWMRAQVPWIERLLDSGQFPLLTRQVIEARSPHDPERLQAGFEDGLSRVLDGLATMLAPGARSDAEQPTHSPDGLSQTNSAR